jgi:hypothetical protein
VVEENKWKKEEQKLERGERAKGRRRRNEEG